MNKEQADREQTLANSILWQDYFLTYLSEDELSRFVYLLKKLGFADNEFLKNYIGELYYKYKPDWIFRSSYDESSDSYSCSYNVEGITAAARKVFYSILNEHDFKINKKKALEYRIEGVDYRTIEDCLAKPGFKDYVTASDIANYVFCPVRFCISKAFIEDEETEEARHGTFLHEQNKLLKYMPLEKGFEISSEFTKVSIISHYNKKFFDDIRNSKIIYVGHSEASKKYFVSDKGKFVGQPDYVFKNSLNEKFIVEEKFKSFSEKKATFQSSHKAQLASYIMGLSEFKATYGYLVYWYYAYEERLFTIKRCDVLRVDSSPDIQQGVRKVYSAINSLNSGVIHSFNPEELNAKKCIRCAASKFCGHKTGRIQTISAPYSKEYYALPSGGFNGWNNSV